MPGVLENVVVAFPGTFNVKNGTKKRAPWPIRFPGPVAWMTAARYGSN